MLHHCVVLHFGRLLHHGVVLHFRSFLDHGVVLHHLVVSHGCRSWGSSKCWSGRSNGNYRDDGSYSNNFHRFLPFKYQVELNHNPEP